MEKVDWYTRGGGDVTHLVYLDNEGKELEKLLNNKKTMIVRGAAAKKSPLGGRAKIGDVVYFVEKGGDMIVEYRAIITSVIEQFKMLPEESTAFLQKYGGELNLSPKQFERWNGKKCLGVYEIKHIEKIELFKYKREKNMDDWIITEDITLLKDI